MFRHIEPGSSPLNPESFSGTPERQNHPEPQTWENRSTKVTTRQVGPFTLLYFLALFSNLPKHDSMVRKVIDVSALARKRDTTKHAI